MKSYRLWILMLIVITGTFIWSRKLASRAQAINCYTRSEVANACFTASPKCLYIFETKVYLKGQCTQSATDPNAWKIGAHRCENGDKYCHPCGTDITNVPEFTTPTDVPYNLLLCTALGITNCTILELHKNPILAYFTGNVDGFLTGGAPECPGPAPTPTPRPSPSPSPTYTTSNLKNLLINYAKAQTLPLYPDGKNNMLDAAVIIQYL